MIPVDGGELYVEHVGSGPPLVLLHGGLLDASMWDEQAERLAGSYTVIRYDARGHGRSSTPAAGYSHADDLRALLRAEDVTKATFVGLSLGGRTLVDFALLHPTTIEALVLVAPGVSGMRFEDPAVLEYDLAMSEAMTSLDAARFIELFCRMWVDGPRRTPDDVDAVVRARCQLMAARTLARHAGSTGVARELGAIDRLGELAELVGPDVPALLVVGDLDSSDIHRVVAELHAALPWAGRVDVPGAGHMVNLDRPDTFNNALEGFLRDRLG
jgi:pimeloyl-ACP methyl ester carboxylesterase